MDDKLTLNAASADLSQSVNRRLLLWTARWAIGFGIIALVVHLWPPMSWLWWAGGAVAALSLVTTLAMSFFLQRKIAAVQAKIATAERLVTESGQEASRDGA